MKQLISILGSTGSIGLTTLKILDKKKRLLTPYIFLANKNYKRICHQIKIYKPRFFLINDEIVYKKIKKKFHNSKTIIVNSLDKIKIKKKSDITISAIPGIIGLKPTIYFTKISNKILIANKESIICGWYLIKKAIKKNNTKIIPIDSEHFSLMNLLKNHNISEINKIYITASGGPFLNYKSHLLKNIKPINALKHPKWKMGKKISIDSATLMNKILELIEAQKLFDIPAEKLDIIIHPNSLVHAIIDFRNGLKKFIYHETTMVIPIANAIFDGKLDIRDIIKIKNNLKNIQNLTFSLVDKKTFPIIKILNRISEYFATPIIINSANEVLVDHFLREKIPFLGIQKIILNIMKDKNYKKYAIRKPNNFNTISKIDNWAKHITNKKIKYFYGKNN
tara:strand:+ start:434 stop:1615 length:1182 start_codon:yes stop_codon:yes gene_type:complete